MDKHYNKYLFGRNEEKNNCYTQEGEILVIGPGKSPKELGRLQKDVHYFMGINSKLPALYGWVKEIEDKICAKDLAIKAFKNPTENDIQLCKKLLEAIEKEKDGTPMFCRYAETGIIEKKRELVVHRVFFYHSKKS